MRINKILLIAMSPCYVFTSQVYALSWTEAINELSFIADSEVEIATRNLWYYLKTENRYDNTEQRYKTQVAQAWGQGLTVDYKSGYIANFIGFDVSYYGGVKLAASDQFSSRAVLYNDDGHAKGYNKIGQRYAKMKMDFDPVQVNVKSGWFTIRNTGIFTNSQRMSLNTHSGWFANLAANDIDIDLLYLDDKVMRRDSPNIQRMTIRDGNGTSHSVDNVITGGVNYRTQPLRASYFYGAVDNVFRQQGFEGSFNLTPELTLQTQVYGQEFASNGKRTSQSTSLGRQHFDKNAWHYAGTLVWRIADTPWTVRSSLTYTDAEKSNGVGAFARNAISNTRGRFNSPAYADIDYTRDGETMLGLSTEYRINPQLAVGLRTNYSQFSYQGVTLKQGQAGLYSYWQPTRNWSVALSTGLGWHHEQESDYTTPKLYNGHSQRAHSLAGSMNTTYRFKL